MKSGVGIESLAFYVPRYYLEMRRLAEARGVEPDKFVKGLGQEKMAVVPPDEDIVTMGANAGRLALQQVDPADIDTVLFATESGVDESKAAAIYVHRLLGLKPDCKTVELKQACSSSTVALLAAQALVASGMDRKVLVVAADVARYDLGSPAEATQGAGAVALVVSCNPRILRLEPVHSAYTEDVMDFWRPPYRREALVDGKYSIKVYINALCEAWRAYAATTGRSFEQHDRFCYHLPFTRMAEKAHAHLVSLAARKHLNRAEQEKQIAMGLVYNRVIGNTYTASLYIGLASLLENDEDLTGSRIALFAYGSGCLGIFFSGTVCPGYAEALPAATHRRLLREREEVSVAQYEQMYHFRLPEDGSSFLTPRTKVGAYRLAGIRDHQRIYEVVKNAAAEEPAPRALAAETAF